MPQGALYIAAKGLVPLGAVSIEPRLDGKLDVVGSFGAVSLKKTPNCSAIRYGGSNFATSPATLLGELPSLDKIRAECSNLLGKSFFDKTNSGPCFYPPGNDISRGAAEIVESLLPQIKNREDIKIIRPMKKKQVVSPELVPYRRPSDSKPKDTHLAQNCDTGVGDGLDPTPQRSSSETTAGLIEIGRLEKRLFDAKRIKNKIVQKKIVASLLVQIAKKKADLDGTDTVKKGTTPVGAPVAQSPRQQDV